MPNRIDYNKLVRDGMALYLTARGKQFAVKEMSPGEYKSALGQKMVEEASELDQAIATYDIDKIVAEMVDLRDLLAAIEEAYGIENAVAEARIMKNAERGGFQHGIKLLWTEDDGTMGTGGRRITDGDDSETDES